MNRIELSTDFASPTRSSQHEINSDVNYFKTLEGLKTFLDAIPSIVLVLNNNRQIVYGNRSVLSISDTNHLDDIYGKRPGELLDCAYAYENQAGCGTSVFCRNCNGAKSILKSLNGEYNIMDCTILKKNKSAFDLRVCSHPFSANSRNYVVFTAMDISHEKRRKVLEKTFFHDIANVLTGVQGYGELMKDLDLGNASKWLANLRLCADEAISEIHAQRSLLAAEDGDLFVEKKLVDSEEILNSVKNMIEGYSFSGKNSKHVIIEKDSVKTSFINDATLLSRVLLNLLKNAVETSGDSPITIGCRKQDNNLIFYVRNRTYMKEDIRNQIFKRSFSTKGEGRGIGTYSVKLLTEKYLGGKVYFTSDEKEGTTFFVELPV